MNENKQEICDALAEALKLTRDGANIARIEYNSHTEHALIYFKDDAVLFPVNVTCDSGIAMIRDIMRVMP